MALLLLAAAAPSALAADPAWPTMQKAGMTGTWAANCTAPAHPDNPYDTFYGDAAGKAGYRSNRGADGIANVTILEARVLTATTIFVRLKYDDPKFGQSNGLVVDAVREISGRKMRPLKSTVVSTGKVLVDNGKLTSNNHPSPVYERCGD